MTDTPDLREQVVREFREAVEDQLSWTPYESVERHRDEVLDAVEAAWPSYVRRLLDTCTLLRDRLGDTTTERDAAQGQLERLHSWAGLMELLDEHWPADIFPGPENVAEEREDDGPRVVSLIRALDKVGASRRDWAAEAAAMDALAERMLTFHSQHDDRLSFVARRYLAHGSGANFQRSRCTGISSDALAWFAVDRRDEPKPHEYPADEADLAACERTYKMAPQWLQERMLPVLERYRAHVAGSVHPDSNGGAE